MQNQLRDKLESAALRLDDYLDSIPDGPGRREGPLLSAVEDIAQAIEMLNDS